MNENIGKTIKGLAKVVLVFGIIISVIYGFYMAATLNNWGIKPALVMICGVVGSIVGAIFIYAFGEFMDLMKAMEESLAIISSRFEDAPPALSELETKNVPVFDYDSEKEAEE